MDDERKVFASIDEWSLRKNVSVINTKRRRISWLTRERKERDAHGREEWVVFLGDCL